MEELLKQIELLKGTLETVVQRQEQIFKLWEERLSYFLTQAEAMTKSKEGLDLTVQALQQSLSENDKALDDLAQITATNVKIIRPALNIAAQKEQ